MKSVGSTTSMKSVVDDLYCEKVMDLEDNVNMACSKFRCPCKIYVRKDFQQDDFFTVSNIDNPMRQRRNTAAIPKPQEIPQSDKTDTTTTTEFDKNAVVVTALYDKKNRVVENLLEKLKTVPRVLIQILGIIAPYYRQLTKMIIKRCKINSYTIYEMSNFLPLTSITEICLDDSSLPQAYYALLLENPCRLTNLSLCRCNINDEICENIASKLHFLESAEVSLSALNLSSNRITDVGAKHIGEALRTNRHLRYLNLADNRIGDEGADHILHPLIEFVLTYDEIISKRQRFMKYLKTRQEIYRKYLAEADSRSVGDLSVYSKKNTAKKKKTSATSIRNKARKDKLKPNLTVDDLVHDRAEMICNGLIGHFVDPFTSNDVRTVAEYSCCIGNMVLCYLNLSYNRLSYMSIKKLHSVLVYQSANKRSTQTGLMRVSIEGNPVPVTCNDMDHIGDLLQKNVINFSAKYQTDKRKSCGRISILHERVTGINK